MISVNEFPDAPISCGKMVAGHEGTVAVVIHANRQIQSHGFSLGSHGRSKRGQGESRNQEQVN
jgi:hypothetical protein